MDLRIPETKNHNTGLLMKKKHKSKFDIIFFLFYLAKHAIYEKITHKKYQTRTISTSNIILTNSAAEWIILNVMKGYHLNITSQLLGKIESA